MASFDDWLDQSSDSGKFTDSGPDVGPHIRLRLASGHEMLINADRCNA